MAKDEAPPKRRNRTLSVADALAGALDPVLRKRGFASRDIIASWPVLAPAPFDTTTFPDKLVWPRGEKSPEGATLYLRCAPGHALAAAHEGPRIAAAINRYFGFFLVGTVRLSAEPFVPAPPAPTAPLEPSAAIRRRVEGELNRVDEPELREALRRLGHALLLKAEQNDG
jgi:hypothetical protein